MSGFVMSRRAKTRLAWGRGALYQRRFLGSVVQQEHPLSETNTHCVGIQRKHLLKNTYCVGSQCSLKMSRLSSSTTARPVWKHPQLCVCTVLVCKEDLNSCAPRTTRTSDQRSPWLSGSFCPSPSPFSKVSVKRVVDFKMRKSKGVRLLGECVLYS